MARQPTLTTERLVLRPYRPDDAPELQRLIGDRDIAATTLNIPHPYEDGMAEEWIAARQAAFDREENIDFAIAHREGGYLIGGIGLGNIERHHERVEIGYWIGKSYWNQGFCTEAAMAVVKYCFDVLGLNRIHAWHFTSNPASGRVMQKIGMKKEGYLRHHVNKWGELRDVVCYGILRSEYNAAHQTAIK